MEVTTTPVLGPTDVAVAEGVNTIVYAWGSLSANTLQLAVQTIGGLHSAPSGVPSGELGLASDAPTSPIIPMNAPPSLRHSVVANDSG